MTEAAERCRKYTPPDTKHYSPHAGPFRTWTYPVTPSVLHDSLSHPLTAHKSLDSVRDLVTDAQEESRPLPAHLSWINQVLSRASQQVLYQVRGGPYAVENRRPPTATLDTYHLELQLDTPPDTWGEFNRVHSVQATTRWGHRTLSQREETERTREPIAF